MQKNLLTMVEQDKYQTFVKLEMSVDQELNLFLGIIPAPKQLTMSFSMKNEGDGQQSDQHLKTSFTQNGNLKVKKQQQSHSQASGKENCYKSHHHNLQKHTVSALRDIIKLECFQEYTGLEFDGRKAKALWKQFVSIRGKQVMTKKFLAVLFSNEVESVPALKDFGFKDIFTTMTNNEIMEAKTELRKFVILQLNDSAVEKHLEKRQVQRKQEFRLYLLHFREELQSANLRKRMTREMSKELKLKARTG